MGPARNLILHVAELQATVFDTSLSGLILYFLHSVILSYIMSTSTYIFLYFLDTQRLFV